jgi:hypothetical protein
MFWTNFRDPELTNAFLDIFLSLYLAVCAPQGGGR